MSYRSRIRHEHGWLQAGYPVSVYTPSAGAYLPHVAKEVAGLASAVGPIRFTFNGHTQIVNPGDTVKQIEEAFVAACDEATIANTGSVEYLRQKLEDEEIYRRHRRETERLLRELPEAVTDEARMVDWVRQFALHGDFNESHKAYDPIRVAQTIEAAGWVRNAECGHSERHYKDHLSTFARWIVGQALDGLHRGFAPHQVLIRFAEDYVQAKEEGNTE